ncbi:MAG: thioredoxin family protein [Bacteroidetes bacterium]|nr:MAG: thioredoxin family protein [Bacteroidota bacterium]
MKRLCRYIRGLGALAVLLWWGTGPALAQDQELPLGAPLPSAELTLTRPDGRAVSLQSLLGSAGTVIVFWSNQCPWVDKYEDRLADLAATYGAAGFAFLVVNANDADAFPKEGADESQARARDLGAAFTYLMDNGSALARALGASRTPHVFVFDANRTLVYVGTIDDSPGDPGNVQKTYLKDVLDALQAGQSVAVPKTKAFGCTIKLQS